MILRNSLLLLSIVEPRPAQDRIPFGLLPIVELCPAQDWISLGLLAVIEPCPAQNRVSLGLLAVVEPSPAENWGSFSQFGSIGGVSNSQVGRLCFSNIYGIRLNDWAGTCKRQGSCEVEESKEEQEMQ